MTLTGLQLINRTGAGWLVWAVLAATSACAASDFSASGWRLAAGFAETALVALRRPAA